MSLEQAYQILYIVVLLMFGILIAVMLIRSVTTKGVMERILCVNMLSTMVICSIAILSRMMDESFLLDVALIYAMISFVTVLILSLTHIPPGAKRHRFHEDPVKTEERGASEGNGAQEETAQRKGGEG